MGKKYVIRNLLKKTQHIIEYWGCCYLAFNPNAIIKRQFLYKGGLDYNHPLEYTLANIRSTISLDIMLWKRTQHIDRNIHAHSSLTKNDWLLESVLAFVN